MIYPCLSVSIDICLYHCVHVCVCAFVWSCACVREYVWVWAHIGARMRAHVVCLLVQPEGKTRYVLAAAADAPSCSCRCNWRSKKWAQTVRRTGEGTPVRGFITMQTSSFQGHGRRDDGSESLWYGRAAMSIEVSRARPMKWASADTGAHWRLQGHRCEQSKIRAWRIDAKASCDPWVSSWTVIGSNWHLGSLTAENWVSFDFNVSYSSCWGYSLINTLKLKNWTARGDDG